MAATAHPRTSLPVRPPEVAGGGPAPAPTRMDCLRCQLLGRRRLMCSRADACRDLPFNFALGPVMLGAWILTAIGFVASVWTR